MKAKKFLDCFFELSCKFSKRKNFLKIREGNERRLIIIIEQGEDVHGDAIEILHELDLTGFGYFLSSNLMYNLLKLTDFDEDETIHAVKHYKFSGGQLLDICKKSRKVKICQAALAKKKMTEKQIAKLKHYFRWHSISMIFSR